MCNFVTNSYCLLGHVELEIWPILGVVTTELETLPQFLYVSCLFNVCTIDIPKLDDHLNGIVWDIYRTDIKQTENISSSNQ